jgi:hypothetical protein
MSGPASRAYRLPLPYGSGLIPLWLAALKEELSGTFRKVF